MYIFFSYINQLEWLMQLNYVKRMINNLDNGCKINQQ